MSFKHEKIKFQTVFRHSLISVIIQSNGKLQIIKNLEQKTHVHMNVDHDDNDEKVDDSYAPT